MTAATEPGTTPGEPGVMATLRPALRRLDELLQRAIARAEAAYGAEAAGDRYRGLYVSAEDVDRLLAREPGAPLLYAADGGPPAAGDPERSRLAWLAATYDLTPFDVDVVVLALAPEIDQRYERLYAYLQDDVTRRRPTVGLALDLLCASAEERIARRASFGTEGPLVRHDLVELPADGLPSPTTSLARAIRLDDQVVSLLLEDDALDPRLAPFCRYRRESRPPEGTSLPAEVRAAFAAPTARARRRLAPLRLYLHGSNTTERADAAGAIAAAAGAPLLEVDLLRLTEAAVGFEHGLTLSLREALLRGATVHLQHADKLLGDERPIRRSMLARALASFPGGAILSGSRAGTAGEGGVGSMLDVPLVPPAVEVRLALWRRALADADVVPPEEVGALAARFRLTSCQIARAVATAVVTATLRDAAAGNAGGDGGDGGLAGPTTEDLFAGARAQSGHQLAELASRVVPSHDWDDLVLPADEMEQLRELRDRVAHRDRVLAQWGFAARLSRGRGVSALFSGPSGTGKTMAAEVIARALGLDLYRVELAGVVSKYIGETEKNLDRIFDAAAETDAVLFFDEADAIFGKRSEVHDAHDRYANTEISYLLQKMEDFEGVVILATNLRGNLDAAFLRRLAFIVHFPAPDDASRRLIWNGIWPGGTPVDPDVDRDLLARDFELTGGSIRNIAVGAAFLAAADGGRVTMAHVLAATRREYQKLGKAMTAEEMGA